MKLGLENVAGFVESLGNPHASFPAVHIAGTNGKGSTVATLASVLRSAGYKTGVFTSPHLVDFRERIRIDGQKIDRRFVGRFIERHR
ncbi:MAG: bifunctional folylpolyglutamate synthase/dihydrofolate synthase, partial [Candidatus Zixiibacteriota bacterium]